MTRLLSAEDREKVRKHYSDWCIYKLLAEPAQVIALNCHPFSLSPEEVFYETIRVVDHFRFDETDELDYAKKLWGSLCLSYRDLEGADSPNSKLCASLVAYSVLTLIMAYQNGRTSKILNAIGEKIDRAGHFNILTPIFTSAIQRYYHDPSAAKEWKEYFDSDECISDKLKQEFLSPTTPFLLPQRTSSDEDIRIGIIRSVWRTAKENKNIKVNQSSLFYIYRIMAENGWYKMNSYRQFMMDVESAEIEAKDRLALSAYSRKNKDFKPDEHLLETIAQEESHKPGVLATEKYIADFTQRLCNYYHTK